MKPIDNSTIKSSNNPYHVSQLDLPFSPEETGALGALKQEVDDLVKLELTAEQMLGAEVDLAKAYIREDAHSLWADMKLGLYELELITGDWQLHHWWGDDETHLH